jgi:peptide/nickel transport system permease protein
VTSAEATERVAPARSRRGWGRRLARRLAGGVGVLFGAATVAFVAMQLIPGDPARAIVGTAPATPGTLAAIRADMGLDRPLPIRYLHYLDRLAHGDLGTSYQAQQPVSDLLRDQVWPTAQLAVAAFVLALLGAVTVATLTAARRPALRAVVRGAELAGASTPTFWLGLILLTIFSFRLGWFPVGPGLRGLVLPAITLAVPLGSILAQVLRESMEQAVHQPFVLSARARGASETGVRVRHVLRHALITLCTLSGWLLGGLMGGTVVVETVFARPGLGRVTLTAVTSRDFPVVVAAVMFSALIFVVVNTVVDALYPVIDPRLRDG